MKVFNFNDARKASVDNKHRQRWVREANAEYGRLKRLGNKEHEAQRRAVAHANKVARTTK